MNNKTLKKLAMIGVASAIMLSVQEGEASYRRTNQGYIANNCGAGSCGGNSITDSVESYDHDLGQDQYHGQYQRHDQGQYHQGQGQYQRNDQGQYHQGQGQYKQDQGQFRQNKPIQGDLNTWNGKGGYNSNLNGNGQSPASAKPAVNSINGSNTSAKRDPHAQPSYPSNYSKNSFSPNNGRQIADNDDALDDHEADDLEKKDIDAKKPSTQANNRKPLSPRQAISQKSPYKKINNQYYRTHITEAEKLDDLDDDGSIINPKPYDGSKTSKSAATKNGNGTNINGGNSSINGGNSSSLRSSPSAANGHSH